MDEKKRKRQADTAAKLQEIQKNYALRKPERQHRFALTILFTIIVIVYIFLTVLVVGLALYLLIRLGVLEGAEHTQLPGTSAIIFYGTAALPVGCVITYLSSKSLLKPINNIINQMNRLASGDYKARIDLGPLVGQHSTFKEMTDSFNRMAQELESTEMLRSDFINNFSHEFKTPIVSIAGFAKLLRKGELSEAQKEDYLEIIERESLRLSQMATNVLNLTKVENQTVLEDVTAYNLSEQIRYAILLLEGKWTKREIEFVLDFAEHQITASEELLKQVWINLLDNAIKYSPVGGQVEVSITSKDDRISVAVINAGPDIPMETQEKIFGKFYQADESHASEGNGVGLAIVKKVVELHCGFVDVKSEGGITVFTVNLPQGSE